MRRVLRATAGLLCIGGFVLVSSAQSLQPQNAPAYENRCASCHGSAMTGATGPSILTYVRYHVDKELIRAMDPFTAKKVWDLPNPGGEPGILSTASGLVFLPGDGGLLVLDGKSGKALHTVNLGHISAAAPMTYMVGGKQYIALHGTAALTVYALH